MVVLLVLGLFGFFYYQKYYLPSKEDSVLQNLLLNPYAKGQLHDNYNQFSIDSIEDIGYYVDDKNTVTVRYGNQEFSITEVQLTQDVVNNLETIGLKLYKSKKTGKIILEYKGERIEPWISKDQLSPLS